MIQAFLIRLAADSSCSTINGDRYCSNLPAAAASSANVQHLLQVIIGILAAVAVLIIVIASFDFVTGGSDPQRVAKARGAIVYALIGLAVAVSAEAIVTFVLGNTG